MIEEENLQEIEYQKEDIDVIFPRKCDQIAEKTLNASNYILHISGTIHSVPNVAAAVSNNTVEILDLNNGQLCSLSTINDSTSPITGLKYLPDNKDLLYVACEDSINLWDLRAPKKPAIRFLDAAKEDGAKSKVLISFDVSQNNNLLAAGTEVCYTDSFIIFWDSRNAKMQGGYWESHTGDITQVKFHDFEADKLISGSTDGLINIYDISKETEDDALIDTLNTEASIDKLIFYVTDKGKPALYCSTNTYDVQLWKIEEPQPFVHFNRTSLNDALKVKSANDCYIVGPHQQKNEMLLVLGSKSTLRGVRIGSNNLTPCYDFKGNHQSVLCSYYNENSNVLMTGGESGKIDVWNCC